MKKLQINNQNTVTEYFRGINVIHQLYNYMPDEQNRLNTPELIKLELETLKKMGVKQVRSFYGSSLSWDAEKGVHDFDSVWMQAFYQGGWVSPVIDAENRYDQELFDTIVAEAKMYVEE